MKGKHIKKKKVANLFKRNTIAIVFLFFLIALSASGATYAWFTSNSITLTNYFTAGTVIIDATETFEIDSSLAVVAPIECFDKQFIIENTGTKAIYVRALFEGYWKYMVHKNTATASATYNGQTVTASNSAYYHFKNPLPGLNPDHGTGQSFGFTGYDSLAVSSIYFPNFNDSYAVSQDIQTEGAETFYSNDSNDGGEQITQSSLAATGKGVVPVYLTPPATDPLGPDPTVESLESPCGSLYALKIDIEDEDYTVGEPLTFQVGDNNTTVAPSGTNPSFSVTIIKNANGTFNFLNSNQPIYHVWVKGGPGGYLFSYYNPGGTPNFEDGVRDDTGLYSPQPGWSHITFYFCEFTAEPSLDIIKEVFDYGDSNWVSANSAPGPKLESPNIPKFRFTVTNTGNVALENIIVTDNKLGAIGTIPSLAVSASESLEFTDTSFDWGNLTAVNAINSVTNELCSNMTNWVPTGVQTLETYFYYTSVLPAYNPVNPEAHKIPLCVNFCLTDNMYAGNELIIYAYFDAVQSTHGLIDHNWDGYQDVWPTN